MGLRDRYLSALVARCVVAVPRERNTQQPAKLLRVAAPRDTQHATTDPALPARVMAATLHATNDATTTQHAQQADYEAKIERSAVISADGVPYWESDDLAGLPAWTDAEIVTFDKRVARITWLGYSDAVSYTHLDVYKRQGWCGAWAASCSSGWGCWHPH